MVYVLAVISMLLFLGGCRLTVGIKDNLGGSITSIDGNINCPDQCTYEYGSEDTVTLYAVPDSGYVFSGFENPDVCSNQGEPSFESGECRVFMDSNQTVVAVFSAMDGNQKPVVSFAEPSTENVGANLSVIVNAMDPDGKIEHVALTINNLPIRKEFSAPYEWGMANNDWTDAPLLNVPPGTHTLRAEATDNEGATTSVSRTVKVVNDDSGGDDVVAPTTMTGKIMAGYQGWFTAKNDGGYNKWDHWCDHKQDMPRPDNVKFDMWPDLREYAAKELYPTAFTYADGSNAGLYSAYNASTVDRHMKWCRDYGIDGVYVQRFMAAIHDGKRAYRDKVLLNVKAGAEKYGRVFANMWDINSLENKDPNGWHDAGLVDKIKQDWRHLVDNLRITESSRYLKHNGRPLIAIWGVSKEDVMDAQYADDLVDWFHKEAAPQYRASVMFGVTNEVGSTKVDWQDKPSAWQNVFRKLDIISPWTVGRFRGESGADHFYTEHVKPDKEKCDAYGVDYLPVVFPGFSACQKHDKECNATPRNGGKFMWRQFYNAMRAGSEMVYVAMFDEVDEGTAIYKIAENQDQTPVQWPSNMNHHEFIALDADGYDLPSDWYLRLTGEAAKMLRNEIVITPTIPIAP